MAAGAQRRQHVLARGLDPADQLDDQIGAVEDLLEVAARARQHAGDLGRAAGDALDRVGALAEQRRERRADGAVAEQADAPKAGIAPIGAAASRVLTRLTDIARCRSSSVSRRTTTRASPSRAEDHRRARCTPL